MTRSHLALVLTALSVGARGGLDRVERFEDVPYLERSIRTREFSSFKRIAEVADYKSWLHVRDGERVMFDARGPGRVTRFWITGARDHDSRINFYFDGETNASFSATPHELFESGMFPAPLVVGPAESAGGRVCYVPFPYERSLRITESGAKEISYYNITYEKFPFGEPVETWTGLESFAATVAVLNAPGADPKPTAGNAYHATNVVLAAGDSVILLDASGAGSIRSLRLDPSPASPSVLEGCLISLTFDGVRAVDEIPIGEFFGSAVGELELASMPLGMRTNGDWYCFFPMPFWESVHVELRNDSDVALTNVASTIGVSAEPYDPARAGYFHATRRSAAYEASASDLVLFDASGSEGKFVGLSLYMEGDGLGLGGMYYLEGDARVYIDGSKHPAIHGTGNEDWFNGAYYYNDYADRGANQAAELFSAPFHGLPAKHHFHGADSWTQAYRFNIPDPIGWTSSMLFTIEHGQYPNYDSGYYSCVAYSYQRLEAATFVGARVDAATAENHFHATDGRLSTNTAKFITPKAEVDAEEVSLVGFEDVRHSRFSISVPPDNEGVALQFLSDFSAGTNAATIRVNGAEAGGWIHSDLNYTNSAFGWGVSEIVLPARLTEGKRRLDLAVSYSGPATEYGVIARPIAARSEPGDAYLAWVEGFEGLGCFTNMTDDVDRDAVDNLAEFAVGGNPSDRLSAGFSFPPRALEGEVELVHVRRVGDHGLTYAVERVDNLASNQWRRLETSLVGVGDWNDEFEVVTNRSSSLREREFFRVRVESN